MTQQAFQTAWARLIVEPDFRDAVRAGVQGALGTGLTPLEGSRLVRIAAEVMSYERDTLDLERARLGAAPAQELRFRHDPAQLLACLAAGRRPRRIRRRRCALTGSKSGDEPASWRVVDEPVALAPRALATVAAAPRCAAQPQALEGA